ncbi:hypothetical protein LIER_07684 [Lithospermum erythrorhizon]|uniref:Late embryogenesis abundant protein LEA-2 subgroup domain-containing protein n=1 Tax=Lithospermum erythrorhizon TaxID=34254 RepID=A0AAV3PA79_LITER
MSKKYETNQKTKCLACFACLAILHIAIILVFALVFMRSSTPKIELSDISIDNNVTSSSMAVKSSSLDMILLTKLSIKNPNFGSFKYEDSRLEILYRGMVIGDVVIPKGRVRARKTKHVDLVVEINDDRLSPQDPGLSKDIHHHSKVVKFHGYAKLSGKVYLMMALKRKKSCEMNCSWEMNLSRDSIQNLSC